jgi:hypothetical protein
MTLEPLDVHEAEFFEINYVGALNFGCIGRPSVVLNTFLHAALPTMLETMPTAVCARRRIGLSGCIENGSEARGALRIIGVTLARQLPTSPPLGLSGLACMITLWSKKRDR